MINEPTLTLTCNTAFSKILKRFCDFLLCTKKETNRYSRSVFIIFTVHVTKQHPVNISFLKKLIQRILEA